jgi:hypothetical protein
VDIPKAIPSSHPLARNLSIKQILKAVQDDVLALEKNDYETTNVEPKGKHGGPQASPKQEDLKKQLPKTLIQIQEEQRAKAELPQVKVHSPHKARGKGMDSITILGTYVKNPKLFQAEQADGNNVQSNETQKSMNIPSIKIRDKHSKGIEKELMMFKEIFVHPKESKLTELQKREGIQDNNLLYRAKQLHEGKTEDFGTPSGKNKGSGKKQDNVVEKDEELKSLLEEPEVLIENEKPAQTITNDIIGIVMRMFNSRIKAKGGESFFSQQIQVQPPEGLNSTVAAPLTPGGGWAPSIPSLTGSISKASFKDLTIRAKAGVQAGDIQKEAHMSFCLGVMNEDMKRYLESIKFYKRFFFCARLLDDPVGAGLALNRLGVVYHKAGRYGILIRSNTK